MMENGQCVLPDMLKAAALVASALTGSVFTIKSQFDGKEYY
jgi:hypothetical protein